MNERDSKKRTIEQMRAHHRAGALRGRFFADDRAERRADRRCVCTHDAARCFSTALCGDKEREAVLVFLVCSGAFARFVRAGHAGGAKYVSHGILFKCCDGARAPYDGDDDAARKVASPR